MTAAGARGSLVLLAGSQAMLFAVTSTLVAVNGLAGLALTSLTSALVAFLLAPDEPPTAAVPDAPPPPSTSAARYGALP